MEVTARKTLPPPTAPVDFLSNIESSVDTDVHETRPDAIQSTKNNVFMSLESSINYSVAASSGVPNSNAVPVSQSMTAVELPFEIFKSSKRYEEATVGANLT